MLGLDAPPRANHDDRPAEPMPEGDMKTTRRFLVTSLATLLLVTAPPAASAEPATPQGAVPVLLIDSIGDSGDGVCDATECTLREAIAAANTTSDFDAISFADGLRGEIDLSAALPDLSTDMSIAGPGARQLTVRRDTGGSYRIFTVSGSATVAISGLTISGGNANVIGVIFGGGIDVAAGSALDLEEVRVIGNTGNYGGGISNSGTTDVTASTIGGNTANYAGGGVYNEGVMTIVNSTVADNAACCGTTQSYGGGIATGGGLTVLSSTVAANRAGSESTIDQSQGGGIHGNVTLGNSMVADNAAWFRGADTLGTVTSQGHNLVEDTDWTLFTGDETGNVYGQDPRLGNLRDNGGSTDTMALASDSPALDSGATLLPSDQRGVTRPEGDADDIGAFERRDCTSDPLVVTTSSDLVIDDDCVTSLREALVSAGLNPGTDTITFDIPGSGTQTITPASALPDITEAVVIDGYSQPGAAPATSSAVATILVEIRGTDAGPSAAGFNILGPDSTVEGLSIGDFEYGVVISGADATGNSVQGNLIGLAADGTLLGNSADGVLIDLARDNLIGGPDPADRNVISGNGAAGVDIRGDGDFAGVAATSGNSVQGNLIGTDPAGDTTIPNIAAGVLLADRSQDTAVSGNLISGNGSHGLHITGQFGVGSTIDVLDNRIGTDAAGATELGNDGDGIRIHDTSGVLMTGNVLSGNGSDGLDISGLSGGSGAQRNRIGTDLAGTGDLGNDGHGVKLSGSNFITIGTTTAIGTGGNTIAFNGLDGIAVTSGNDLLLLGNAIFSNGGLGIDLGDDGATPDDDQDSDSGPNNLQNYPVLTSVTTTESGSTIAGTLDSAPSTQFDLQFFSSPTADPSGFGEGMTLLGSTTVNTDANGHVAFSADADALQGDFVTATATQSASTSEFSAAFEAEGPPELLADLSIEKSGPETAAVGQPFEYTLTVTNQGPDAASGIEVLDDLPPGLTYQDESSTASCRLRGGTADPNDVRCTLASLDSGGEQAFTISVVASEPGPLSNTTSVGSDTADPDDTNDESEPVLTEVQAAEPERYDFRWVGSTRGQPALNKAPAGSVMRLRFSLGGNEGMDILTPDSPWHQRYLSCPTGPMVEETRRPAQPPGSIGLRYKSRKGIYVYRWQTSESWFPGQRCHRFALALDDGSTHYANIKLTRPVD